MIIGIWLIFSKYDEENYSDFKFGLKPLGLNLIFILIGLWIGILTVSVIIVSGNFNSVFLIGCYMETIAIIP